MPSIVSPNSVNPRGSNGVNAALRGKTIRMATHNGSLLRLTFTDGTERDVAWVDDNGQPIRGTPVMWFDGLRLRLGGKLRELAHRARLGL